MLGQLQTNLNYYFHINMPRVICENSFGPQDPDVRIALDDVLKLYRVHCSAEKVLLPNRGEITAAKTATTSTPTTKVYDELLMSSAGQMPGKSLLNRCIV